MSRYKLMASIVILDFLIHPFLFTWFSDYSGWREFSIPDFGFAAVLLYTIYFLYLFPVFWIFLFFAKKFWNTKNFVRYLPAIVLCLLALYIQSGVPLESVGQYYLNLWYIIGFFYHLFFAALMLYISLRAPESDVTERLTDRL